MDTKRSKLIASVRLAEGSLEHHAAPSTLLINSYASPARRGLSEPHSDRVESAGLVEGRRRQIEASLEAALQREQRMELRWYQLVRHKLWGYQRCDEQHPPPLPDETEWLGDMPWPRGVSPDGGFFRLCGAFCAFIYNLPCAGKTLPLVLIHAWRPSCRHVNPSLHHHSARPNRQRRRTQWHSEPTRSEKDLCHPLHCSPSDGCGSEALRVPVPTRGAFIRREVPHATRTPASPTPSARRG